MTADELIKTYRIVLDCQWNVKTRRNEPTGRLCVCESLRAKSDGVIDEIKAHKTEIIDILTAEANAKKEAAADRQRRIDAIEGLKEIVEARNKAHEWHVYFIKAMDRGDSVLRSEPKYDFDAAYQKYPKAAAYLKAQSMANKRNDELSAIGRKAVDGILYGDWKAALETMDAEQKAFTDAHTRD